MRTFQTGEVSVADMMQAREERVERQQRLLQEGRALACLTMNIPGPRKTSPLVYIAFQEGKRLLEAELPQAVLKEEALQKTGFEAYYLLPAEPHAAKRALCAIEDGTPLGRLFDIDVLTAAGEKISREELGFAPRRCFLCGEPAFACARSRTHSVAQMREEIERRILAFYRQQTAERLSRAAVEALQAEARTTPKPGLVDERNCGSHPDMNLSLFLTSAMALKNYFLRCAQVGFDCAAHAAFPALQEAGILAEREMLAVTGGVNTHKGAIFSLGILCAAAANCAVRFQDDPRQICQTAGSIARPAMEAHFASLASACTFGERLYLSRGVRGIRGEAADGFPSLLALLPGFEEEAALLSAREAGVRALIRLLSRIQDTTLLKRGGEEGERFARARAREIERAGFPAEAIVALDDDMIARNLTCGGAADLLACLYFLHAIASSGQSPENLP